MLQGSWNIDQGAADVRCSIRGGKIIYREYRPKKTSVNNFTRTVPALLPSTMSLRLAVVAFVMLVLSVPAFGPQYLSKLGAAHVYTHAHAVLGAAWLVLLIVQPLLIRARRVRVHRIVGRFAAVVGALFVVESIVLTHHGAVQMSDTDFARFGHFLYLPLSMAVIFGTALTFGLVWRKVPALHGRFMACTVLPLLDPLLARILGFHFPPLPQEWMYQVPAFAISGSILAGLSLTLPATTPGRRWFFGFAAGTALILLFYFYTSSSSMWFAFVTWFRAL